MQNKPRIFSKIFRFIIVVLIALFITFVLIKIGVPKLITFFIIIVLYLIYTAVWPAHIIYRTRSIALVDPYLKNNARQAIFGYAISLGNGKEQDIENALKKL